MLTRERQREREKEMAQKQKSSQDSSHPCINRMNKWTTDGNAIKSKLSGQTVYKKMSSVLLLGIPSLVSYIWKYNSDCNIVL